MHSWAIIHCLAYARGGLPSTLRLAEFDEFELTIHVKVHHLVHNKVVSGCLADDKARNSGGEGEGANFPTIECLMDNVVVAFGAFTCGVLN
jgi:hypothetical protein